MTRPPRAALALLAALVPTAGGAQQAGPDIGRGRDLAGRWCAECHLVGPAGPGGDAGPAFATLARSRSDAGLRAWIADPHPPMPKMDVSAMAAEDIAAYIRSLGACEANC